MSHRDVSFLLHLSNADLKRHLPGLRSRAAQKYPRLPSTELGYIAEYTSIPPTFDLFTLDEVTTDKSVFGDTADPLTPSVLGNNMVSQVRASNGKITVLKNLFPQGPHKGVRIHMLELKKHEYTNKEIKPPKVRIERTAGQDSDRQPLETVWDRTDEILYRFGLKSPDEWLQGSGDRAQRFYDRIDEQNVIADTLAFSSPGKPDLYL